MSKGSERRFGSAHAIAVVALFVALSGGAYAVVAIPRNSVGTPQLRRSAVTLGKIAAPARRALAGKRGLRGLPGAPGATGDTGPKGDTGAIGPSDAYSAGFAYGPLTASRTAIATVTLPPGDYVLHGKGTITGLNPNEAVGAACFLTDAADTASYDATGVKLAPIAALTGSSVMELDGGVSLASQADVVMRCQSTNGTSAAIDDARLIAIRVGQAHGLPLPID